MSIEDLFEQFMEYKKPTCKDSSLGNYRFMFNKRKQTQVSGYELEQCGGDYEKGNPSGRCDGMGLWVCRECRWRNPEGIKEENEQYLRHHHRYIKTAPRIKAKVRSTGKVIRVDDMPIDGFYNMWHNDENGTPWHDDELEFMEPRLQNII